MDFAGHRVEDKLAEGAMATLWKVRAADGSLHLLKRPKLGMGSHPACFAGFETERMILERLGDPHVPAFVAGGDESEDEGGPWLIEELVAGTSLAEVAGRAPLPLDEFTRLGTAIATALHALHRQNVVHHDLKPQHILFREDGSAVLIDFGLAVHGELPDFAGDAVASDHHPLGTPAYIAPELLRGERGNPRSDIFSLGVILYLLATGRLPFGAPESLTGMRRRLWLDPPRPRALRPELPEWLQEIVMRCLAVLPQNRYATAAQVAHDLSHTQQVVITARGRDLKGGGWRAAARRWWKTVTAASPGRQRAADLLARAPHVLVAIDTEHVDAALADAMREAVRRAASADFLARISCVTVLDASLFAGQDDAGEIERSLRTQRLMALHLWARELELSPERLRFHVLDGSDDAGPLLDHAREHHADHIIIGARGSSALRRLLGSVSARVAAEAPCSVSVIRPR
ncbi:MAG: universal stress protein [Gammaproteobacteria bacterium]|nr:universal stress protein [Gammaproteobacteria bacterium]MBU1644994.1 universal stress protein [Gammaproteobacteria bacterium]MBU1971453.1 universal stress protein [Gammaproteobacteria bacterium]